MAKLKDDHIRWILEVDAKGVQGEIQKLSSVSVQLTKKNKELSIELKAAEKAMNSAEKAMLRLEAAGKTTTKEYERAKVSFVQNAEAVETFRKEIDNNTKAIKANNKAIDEKIKTMKLEDMTMRQLQQRAKNLQGQLNNTAKSTSPEAYAQLEKELSEVNKRMNVLRGTSDNLSKSFKGGLLLLAGALAIKAFQWLKNMAQAAKEFVLEGVKMASVAEGITKAFDRRFSNSLLKELREETKGLLNDVSLMQAAVRADNFNIPVEKLGSLLKFAQQRAQETGESVDYLTKSIIDGLGRKSSLVLDNLNISPAELRKEIDITKDFTLAALNIINRELEKQGDLALTSQDKAVQSAVKWENAQKKVGDAFLGIRNIWSSLSGAIADWISDFAENGIPKIVKGVQNVINAFISLYNHSMLVRGVLQTIGSVITSLQEMVKTFVAHAGQAFVGLGKIIKSAVTLDFDGIKKAYLETMEDMQKSTLTAKENIQKSWKDTFQQTMNGQVSYVNLMSDPQEGRAGLKPTTTTGSGGSDGDSDNQLKAEEQVLNQQINLLKKKRLEGKLIESEYNKEVERLTIESLNKRLKIKGLEKDNQIQLEQQLLDALLAQQTNADKLLLDALQKEINKELQLIDVRRNARLEQLQEEEADRQLYALRAAEIETDTANKRLAVLKQYGETLQNAEFENNEARIKAVEENTKNILSAEDKALKEQQRLRQQFARTTADFERQYNIKTWEQRKEDELNILTKQYEAKLLSEETFHATEKAINKKYEDEKLQIREQYGIASMSELYNAEMEALLEQHEKGLLSEEEYEKAKLQVKLKYAQEYLSKASEFASMASSAVSALQSAEISNMEAKYDAEIAAAGDNKEEVERLENEKAKKKLDIEKKYADVQFAVTAAEIISSTALAIMQAFSQLGPIAGAVAAALMGVTGAAQLAVANAQRKKVKSMTLSGSSSSSAPASGQIKLKEGFADGGSNAGDYTDGGYTGHGGRYEVAGMVPYHHGEYFVAVPELKNPAVQDHVRAIDKIRRKRTKKNPLPEGFAEGGSNMSANGATNPVQMDTKLAQQLLSVLQDLKDGKVNVNYGITELEAKQREKVKAESNFSI